MHKVRHFIYAFIAIWLYREQQILGQMPYPRRDPSNDIMRLNIPNDRMNINTNTICGNSGGLTRRQYQLCIQEPNAVASAIQGMQIAIYECKRQFKDHRWNCTSLETKNKIPHTSAFFKRGFREASFSYAIASAGVAHAVAHACSLGKITGCGCMPGKRLSASQQRAAVKNNGNISGIQPEMAQYFWSGCDHNINFGIQFSRKFLDEKEQSSDHRTHTMLHNNRVGRLIVANNMNNKCTCHGTSGSCSLKTCWKHTPDFKLVGETIKALYHKAYKIESSNRADGYRLKTNQLQYPRDNLIDNMIDYNDVHEKNTARAHYPAFHVSINTLVYFEDSPDYCTGDKSIGFSGTKGRYCNRTAPAESTNSCTHLCCNRGFKTYKQTRVEKCHCRFHWCCYVECDNCTITEKVAVCR